MRTAVWGESFDLSRRATGVVTWKGDTPMAVLTFALPEGFIGEQLHVFERFMRHHWDYGKSKPTWVAYERASTRSYNHAEIQLALVGTLLKLCFEFDVTVAGFAPSTLKKELAGHGHASKAQMVAAARERFPDLEVNDDNVADALAAGLVFLARAEFVGAT